MNRRQFMRDATVGTAAFTLPSFPMLGVGRQRVSSRSNQAEIVFHVNPKTGDDANDGARATPLRTLAEAGRRVSRSEGTGPITVLLSEGIHSVAEEVGFRPQRRALSRTDRLTIRAEVLPDEKAAIDRRSVLERGPVLDGAVSDPNWMGLPEARADALDRRFVPSVHFLRRRRESAVGDLEGAHYRIV